MNKYLLILVSLSTLSACANFRGPVMLGDPLIPSKKIGEACMERNWFKFEGDGTLAAAKRNGDITQVATVDFSTQVEFPYINGKYCILVSGQ